jgi:hypothetical protein
LREATPAESAQNLVKKAGASGYAGVTPRRGRWVAQISVNYRKWRLGRFEKPEEAHAAYLVAKASLHPFQPQPRGIQCPRA